MTEMKTNIKLEKRQWWDGGAKKSGGRESKVHAAPLKQETGQNKDITHSLNSTLCCGHIPRYLRMASMSVRMSYPLMRAVPDVGGNSPVRMDLHSRTVLNVPEAKLLSENVEIPQKFSISALAGSQRRSDYLTCSF